MNLLETYLRELHETRSTGLAVKETSYYGALANLLNGVGATLKPRVRCVVHVQNQGAGIPDGGLFTSDQKTDDPTQMAGMLPSRGVIEVKGTKEDVLTVAAGPQVAKYWQKYRQVLVTNYRDFALVGQDAQGQASVLEMYRLADGEAAFWKAAAQPREAIDAHGERFIEYIKRVLLHAAPLTLPADVAWHLASYARDAKGRIEHAELPALASVRGALEEALGLTFEGAKGDHFFRSTLIQTLFYGVFSAWVLWSKRNPPNSPARFDWKTAAWELHVPMIRALFEQVASPSKLGPLGLVETLDWTAAALNRVDRAEFFARFEEEHAVQYFYEPFLQAFDPELRRELGVWYTPPEIVEYMVARVDTVLREELGLKAGLADPNVYVLDPCCGTGAFLVGVLKRIAQTLTAQDDSGLVAHDVKQTAMERVFGFEILPAPFVVAHWQLGLYLQHLGAPLVQKVDERVGVYLTNALTGWETNANARKHPAFPEMDDEREAADHVKQDKRILVILGNPPYNGYAGVAVREERVLSDAYRTTKHAPAPQGQGLNDLYIRFFRMAERRIVEQTGAGVVCFISNYSWLDGLSFTGMRERYAEVFDHIWIDNLHGDRIISENAPDGKSSETVFAMEGTSSGIKVGTAISLLVAKSGQSGKATHPIMYRDWQQARATARRAALLESAEDTDINAGYIPLAPVARIGLPFKPRKLNLAYLTWPLLPGVFPVSFPGVKTSRDDVLVDIDRERLLERMKQYFDPAISHEEMKNIAPSIMESGARFNSHQTRTFLLKRGFLPQNVVRYIYRPFDVRWLYWEPDTKLLDEKRSDYFPQVGKHNLFLFTTGRTRKDIIEPAILTQQLVDINLMDSTARGTPLVLRPAKQMTLDALDTEAAHDTPRANLSDAARAYLTALGAGEDGAENLFYHTLAVLHAPTYRDENAGALRQDWPRIPLPDSLALLRHSAELGRQIAALLDVEGSVEGVTSGTIRPELRGIGVIARADGGSLNPDADAGDFALTAGWGHAGSGGVTMPARGKTVSRDYTPDERSALASVGGLNVAAPPAVSPPVAASPAAAPDTDAPDGISDGEGSGNDDLRGLPLLGAVTRDVYLNANVYWRNVPEPVWEYTIGGYQVLKKWLSYRELGLLGRPLTHHEARYVTQMARRITALLLLAPTLDANYDSCKAAAVAF